MLRCADRSARLAESSRGGAENGADVITTLGPVYMNLQQSKLPVTQSVLFCFWTLANQESYRGVADRFNISKSTLAKHLHEFCCYVNTYMAHHISWARGQRLQMSKLKFDLAGFPNTVCAVDGCHIPIRRPHCDNPLAYLNRQQFYSVILTGFCDRERRFCHISVGHPGSWHDARAFRLTEVGQVLKEDPHSLVPQGMHIIGDFAYPLLPQLMRPYRDNGHLTTGQRHFNIKLNAACVVIEHAFGILKPKFRRLQCLHMQSILNIRFALTPSLQVRPYKRLKHSCSSFCMRFICLKNCEGCEDLCLWTCLYWQRSPAARLQKHLLPELEEERLMKACFEKVDLPNIEE
ncbi:uncharacterized protein Hap1MRO34_016708 [Clarias gariepinus]